MFVLQLGACEGGRCVFAVSGYIATHFGCQLKIVFLLHPSSPPFEDRRVGNARNAESGLGFHGGTYTGLWIH